MSRRTAQDAKGREAQTDSHLKWQIRSNIMRKQVGGPIDGYPSAVALLNAYTVRLGCTLLTATHEPLRPRRFHRRRVAALCAQRDKSRFLSQIVYSLGLLSASPR